MLGHITTGGASNWSELDDTPSSITALEFVRGNAGGTALEFAPIADNTLQEAYDASTGGATPEIVVDATRGALTIRDAATPIAANLFEVQDNAGGEILSSSLARPLTTKVVSNSDTVHLRIVQEPSATPNIPYGAIEFYAAIDLVTTTFNSGLIKSGFFNGSGFDKGYMTFCSPVTVGVWNEVLTIRNNRVGIRTTGPLCALHTNLLPNQLTWSDANNRNTAQYHRVNFTPANLTTSLSGLYGVDNVWTGGNASGRSVNATFFLLTVGDASNFSGGGYTSMVGQISVNSSGAVHNTGGGIGMQGKVHFTNSFATACTASRGHTAVEAFLQGQTVNVSSVDLLIGFKTRSSLGGSNLTVDLLRGLHITDPTGGGTLVNQYGIWIENLNFGTTINTAIALDGDGTGSEIQFGDGQDAEIYYDGTDFILDPDVVGSGRVLIGATGDDDMLLNDIEIDGDLNHDGANIGFYGTVPVAKPTVTGSRAGNAALASLLTALAGQGLLTDSSSA